MCIYYIDKKDLSYKGEEHIIPAGLGGIAVLPKGFVSDEFNSMISALELEFFRESIFISLPRQILGPGKRGKLGEKYETKSKVHVLFNNEDARDLSLGYVKKAKSFTIPHVILNTLTGHITLSLNNKEVTDKQAAIREFQDKCREHPSLKVKMILNNELPDHIILFGLAENIEGNYNGFFAHNERSTVKYSLAMVGAIADVNFDAAQSTHTTTYPLSKQNAIFSLDHLRINAKIAFNYLASIMGYDFVRRMDFDPIRKYIANGGENNFVQLDLRSPSIFSETNLRLPPSSHFVYIAKDEKRLIVYLSLFDHFNSRIYMPIPAGVTIPNVGLICDFNNRREITLVDYILEQQQKAI